jgi:demethylmenaquinone methyltransferase/2-methoxy-6-polyprenyl-1,4-benzoquinol methylase
VKKTPAPPLPEGSDKAGSVRAMFDRIAPRYDLLNRIISMGLDTSWRRRAVRALELPPDSLVLDLACGTGDFCRDLTRSGHRPVGFDFAAGMLASARTDAPLVQADVLTLPIRNGAADGATCGFALRNVTDIRAFFEEVARVLRPGARFALLEVAQPASRVLRAGHYVWFKLVVPVLGGLLSDRDAYRYLPRSVVYLPQDDELIAIFQQTGFPDALRLPLSGGVAQLLVGTRR